MLKTQRKGFTLIELLIVVAIIAILAAIAIPNFLAAQVRAKVARVKAGLRTTVTGLESYYVDNNEYPIATRYTTTASGEALGKLNWHIPNSLTTPIAYLTSWPQDPFQTYGGSVGWAPLMYIKPGYIKNNGVDDWWYISVPSNYPGDNGTWAAFYGPNQSGNGANPNLYWYVASVGPKGNLMGMYNFGLSNCYDPTNGTVSNGNIWRGSDGFGASN